MNTLVVVSSIAVLIGLAAMPYGYYGLLRIVLSLTGAVGFVEARRRGLETYMWVFGVVVVVYNPVLPVKLGDKSLWIVVNVVTLIVLWAGARQLAATARRSVLQDPTRHE